MRRSILLLVISLFISYTAFTQVKADLFVATSTKPVGYNLVTEQPILAKCYNFSDRIHDFQVDTVNNLLTLQLRGLSKNGKWLKNKGDVFRYSTAFNKLLWSKKIAYQLESIEQFGGITIHTTAGKSYCLDNDTGRERWEVKNSLPFVDPELHIGIGYNVGATKQDENLLEGVNLTDGNIIWQREISREYSWNDVIYLNDTTLLIAAAGLHTVNLKDGSGWDYDAITGKKDYTGTVVGAGLGIAAGLLTGTYVVPSGHDLVRDIASNVLIDSLNLYFASKESIVKLDKEGAVLWETTLPKEFMSKSLLLKNNDRLILINYGYAYMGYRQLALGDPFVASFDIQTGERIFLTTINQENKEHIGGFNLKDDVLTLIMGDSVFRYSMSQGLLILKRKINTEAYGELRYFLGNHVHVKMDSTFYSIQTIDATKEYLFTKSGKVLVLDQELFTVDKIDYENLYVQYLWRNGLKFLANQNQTIITDKAGIAIANFAASSRSFLLKNKLYSAQESSLFEIDLSGLLQNYDQQTSP